MVAGYLPGSFRHPVGKPFVAERPALLRVASLDGGVVLQGLVFLLIFHGRSPAGQALGAPARWQGC